ncbi:MAG: DUF192 domain-containing protein [Chloroflexota bacterium]|nr:DUF192 domain-containing protein [Dehalococcoidia bacterium]MDW8046427.1 DUF192 domain-containing protein [Chloroflexota bacterium]
MRAAFAAAVAVALLAACSARDSSPAPTAAATELPIAQIAVVAPDGRAFPLTVEVAATPADRERGLMFRQQLAEDAGMLFVFPEETRTSFWMKNTLVPLTIAFLAADGRILAVVDGKPLDETPLDPGVAYRYALEVNQGWFARRGLDPLTARVELPAALPPAR